jgi:hypothetical protein
MKIFDKKNQTSNAQLSSEKLGVWMELNPFQVFCSLSRKKKRNLKKEGKERNEVTDQKNERYTQRDKEEESIERKKEGNK